jgi:hypothetical protein
MFSVCCLHSVIMRICNVIIHTSNLKHSLLQSNLCLFVGCVVTWQLAAENSFLAVTTCIQPDRNTHSFRYSQIFASYLYRGACCIIGCLVWRFYDRCLQICVSRSFQPLLFRHQSGNIRRVIFVAKIITVQTAFVYSMEILSIICL